MSRVPVITQPQANQWMEAPTLPLNCPPGLEYLSHIDQLLVRQHLELLEAVTGCETNNRFEVTNSLGQRVYYATEDTAFCTRYCLGPARPFEIQLVDNMSREVMRLTRPLRCTWGCCLQIMDVYSASGEIIGRVKQIWSCLTPKLLIQNAAGEDVLRITGPCLTCSLCGDVEFDVFQINETSPIGKICKRWTGLAKEMFTDADNFGVSFPMNLDVRLKAMTLAATFLLDYMYFERK